MQDIREGVLWLAVHHQQRKALEIFSMEVASAGTGMGEANLFLFVTISVLEGVNVLYFVCIQ